MSNYNKVLCRWCKKEFEQHHGNTMFCSPGCKMESKKCRLRYYAREHRAVKLGVSSPVNHVCQVCKFELAVILLEGNAIYYLCPNHKWLITHGLKRISDYNIPAMNNKE